MITIGRADKADFPEINLQNIKVNNQTCRQKKINP